MLQKWGLRFMIVLVICVGLFIAFAFTLQVPAVGKTIGSSKACGTCHVMTYEVLTLEKSAHRDLSCLDCHAPKGFVDKPVAELKSASRHMFIFMTNTTPDVIKPYDESRRIVQNNCASCHAKTVGKTHANDFEELGKFCFDCHRDTPHGRPLRN